MPRPPELYQWDQQIAMHFPGLSKPMVMGLALWSLGMIVVGACSLSALTDWWSCRLGQKGDAVRERLRDVYREKEAKAGRRRCELEVEVCWAPWLGWVLEGWDGSQLAVALDATSLGQRFVVLAVSVLYRGCAVPVAWKVLRAERKHPWKPEWLALLKQFKGIVPTAWTVLALTDRGLYAKWLFEGIREMGWHPMLRVNSGGTFRPQGWRHWRPFTRLVPKVGDRWQGRGTAFGGRRTRLDCTLLAYWGEGHKDPWLILTDLPPESADACWYGLRGWIEQSFKKIKGGGWQWQHTRMDDPERAERLWLAIAIATWWLLSVGGEAEAGMAAATFPAIPGSSRQQAHRWRLVGIFRHGRSLILAALFEHRALPVGKAHPEPWPPVHIPGQGPSAVIPSGAI
jgi:hypothetical protein